MVVRPEQPAPIIAILIGNYLYMYENNLEEILELFLVVKRNRYINDHKRIRFSSARIMRRFGDFIKYSIGI